MSLIKYHQFINEEEDSRELQGFVLHAQWIHIGVYYTLPEFLLAVYESEIGNSYEESELGGELLTIRDLENALSDSDSGWNSEVDFWSGLKPRDLSGPKYGSARRNPYLAVDDLDKLFLNSKKIMTLHPTGNEETNMSWLAISIENDPELFEAYNQKHPELVARAMPLVRMTPEIEALLKFHRIKKYI